MREAQEEGKEVSFAHRDQALTAALMIMSREDPNRPPIQPEDITKNREYIRERRQMWGTELDQIREYLPYVQQAYEMLEYSQEMIDGREQVQAEQLLDNIIQVLSDHPTATGLELAFKVINHDTVGLSCISESDVAAKIGNWIGILRLIKREKAATEVASVCSILEGMENLLRKYAKARKARKEADSNAERDRSIKRVMDAEREVSGSKRKKKKK